MQETEIATNMAQVQKDLPLEAEFKSTKALTEIKKGRLMELAKSEPSRKLKTMWDKLNDIHASREEMGTVAPWIIDRQAEAASGLIENVQAARLAVGDLIMINTCCKVLKPGQLRDPVIQRGKQTLVDMKAEASELGKLLLQQTIDAEIAPGSRRLSGKTTPAEVVTEDAKKSKKCAPEEPTKAYPYIYIEGCIYARTYVYIYMHIYIYFFVS